MFTSGLGTAYAASSLDMVKTFNPFVPVIQLMTVAPRRHQEKFKTVMFTILAAFAAFLLVLLAKDYWTGNPRATAPADAANGLATAQGEEGEDQSASDFLHQEAVPRSAFSRLRPRSEA